MKLRKVPRKKRLPKMQWGPVQKFEHGSRYWDSPCGQVRLVASEVYDGIVLPREWKVYRLRNASWCPIGDSKSRLRAERIAREYLAKQTG